MLRFYYLFIITFFVFDNSTLSATTTSGPSPHVICGSCCPDDTCTSVECPFCYPTNRHEWENATISCCCPYLFPHALHRGGCCDPEVRDHLGYEAPNYYEDSCCTHHEVTGLECAEVCNSCLTNSSRHECGPGHICALGIHALGAFVLDCALPGCGPYSMYARCALERDVARRYNLAEHPTCCAPSPRYCTFLSPILCRACHSAATLARAQHASAGTTRLPFYCCALPPAPPTSRPQGVRDQPPVPAATERMEETAAQNPFFGPIPGTESTHRPHTSRSSSRRRASIFEQTDMARRLRQEAAAQARTDVINAANAAWGSAAPPAEQFVSIPFALTVEDVENSEEP